MDPFYYLIAGVVCLILIILFLLIFHFRSGHQPLMGNEQVSTDLYQSVVQQNEAFRKQIAEKEQEIRQLGSKLAGAEQEKAHYADRLETQKAEVHQMQNQMTLQFEQIANRMLEEKGRTLSQHQQQQLGTLLQPLQTRIREFQEDIDRKFHEETKEKVSLRKEIEGLRDLNMQLSQDAHNLTSALKGQSKVQGDWGEYQLELILEKAGLQKGVHYQMQQSFTDEGGQQKRPDFIIQLPEEKHLIIDSKVSLTAFERYFNATDPEMRKMHLKSHVDSLRKHVDQLSKKNYTHISQISSPDYLLLFVPIEGALLSASQADPDLYTDALERNIVIVTTSSLVATMRTVSHIWKQEKQARSVQEIAKQSGLLYDKFVGFVEDLKTIGQRLDSAQSAYHDAFNKLSNSSKYGDTLIGRAEKIRSLGARNSKLLPQELTEAVDEEV